MTFSIKFGQVGDIYYAYNFSSLPEALEDFDKYGYRLCSLDDLVKLRLAEGRINSGVIYADRDIEVRGISSKFDEGPIRVGTSILTIPKRKLLSYQNECWLVRDSPQFRNFDRNSGYFYPNDEQIADILGDAIKYPVQTDEESRGIPTNNFQNNDLAIWMFGKGNKDLAGNYGQILNEGLHNNICLSCKSSKLLDKEQIKPYVERVQYGIPMFETFILLSPYPVYLHNPEHIFGIKD